MCRVDLQGKLKVTDLLVTMSLSSHRLYLSFKYVICLGGRGRQISELEASLVYRVSSRTVRATQRNRFLKKNQKTKKQANK